MPDDDHKEHSLEHIEGNARHGDVLDERGIVVSGSRPQSVEVAVQGGHQVVHYLFLAS